ncbi:MAG: hypothetical protein IIT82_09435 [Selenomonas sp.]|uniref:hypothetical protein n=1 Tax=Selenomonas sp. AE3005 TaxID=1485543 RepID=UPI0004801BF8|nr:hypothetical protein [Selenomonas sp. AE3005]MBQ1415831.1 hypothetical protein [Selenomonas sp.]MBQ1808673.1 hypothetical protein [Selenomonas sp.]MBQ1920792.1 hypothetical protein [Selenomonas sp.]MBQ2088189.1 hypothetical protein [Selenomonas sp.]MBQ5419110.1 hypothetical protein [Selenomonas sp.]
MKDVKRPVREALQQLEQKKMLESSYAEVNKYQSLINLFANLQRACELMADEIGSHTGQKQEEVLAEFYEQAGIEVE